MRGRGDGRLLSGPGSGPRALMPVAALQARDTWPSLKVSFLGYPCL